MTRFTPKNPSKWQIVTYYRDFSRTKPSDHSISHVALFISKNSQNSRKLPSPWVGGACSLPLVPTLWHESGGHNGWKRVEYADV